MLADSTATIYLIKQKDSIKLASPVKFVHLKVWGVLEYMAINLT